MPSVYAHYRFGVQILPALPADVRGAIYRNRSLFDLGLQGPDVFWFYKPFQKSEISKLARKFHYETGRVFFSRACDAVRHDESEGRLAYLYGLLGHYCLDSLCHPYVHEHTDQGPISHNALESEFERHLLALDGCKNPPAYRRRDHIPIAKGDCESLSIFYPPVTGVQFREAATSMRRVLYMLTCNRQIYRTAVETVLGAMGGQNPGLLMHRSPNRNCCHLNGGLQVHYDRAVACYPELLEQLRDYINLREPLGAEFDKIFG